MTGADGDKVECELALVVLGHRMDRGGRPDDVGLARLAIAADELNKNPAALLVTSGWAYRDDIGVSLADAMANAAIDLHGIESERIVRLHDPRDTVGDAVYFARAVRAGSICVVTSQHHRARAERIFRFVLGKDASLEVMGTGGPISPEIEASEARSLRLSRHFVGSSRVTLTRYTDA